MLMVIHKNFKCEDCGNDKFTIKDDFDWGNNDITLYCADKNCGASYTFRPVMKKSMSSHTPKRCSCGFGLLSREDKYCSCCGKKNTYFEFWRKANLNSKIKKEMKDWEKALKHAKKRRKTSSRIIRRK